MLVYVVGGVIIFTKRDRVNATYCDLNAHLGCFGMLCMVQDMVSEILGVVGRDNVTMRNKFHSMWVFVKSKQKFGKKLNWGDEYIAKSYIVSMSSIALTVATEVTDSEGEMVMCSKLELCALDIPTRKIVRLSTIGVDSSMCSPATFELNFDRLTDAAEFVRNVTVESDNVDFSMHTNNTQYYKFVLKTYTVAQQKAQNIAELQINFVAESKENDILSIYKDSHDNLDDFTIKNGENIVSKIEIKFE